MLKIWIAIVVSVGTGGSLFAQTQWNERGFQSPSSALCAENLMGISGEAPFFTQFWPSGRAQGRALLVKLAIARATIQSLAPAEETGFLSWIGSFFSSPPAPSDDTNEKLLERSAALLSQAEELLSKVAIDSPATVVGLDATLSMEHEETSAEWFHWKSLRLAKKTLWQVQSGKIEEAGVRASLATELGELESLWSTFETARARGEVSNPFLVSMLSEGKSAVEKELLSGESLRSPHLSVAQQRDLIALLRTLSITNQGMPVHRILRNRSELDQLLNSIRVSGWSEEAKWRLSVHSRVVWENYVELLIAASTPPFPLRFTPERAEDLALFCTRKKIMAGALVDRVRSANRAWVARFPRADIAEGLAGILAKATFSTGDSSEKVLEQVIAVNEAFEPRGSESVLSLKSSAQLVAQFGGQPEWVENFKRLRRFEVAIRGGVRPLSDKGIFALLEASRVYSLELSEIESDAEAVLEIAYQTAGKRLSERDLLTILDWRWRDLRAAPANGSRPAPYEHEVRRLLAIPGMVAP
jgi:hypothetical protein